MRKEKKKLLTTYIGKRLSDWRKKRGWTLVELGRKVNIAPQQIQKYESGLTALSAWRLYHLSCALGIEPAYFFNGFSEFAKKNVSEQHVVIVPDRRRSLRVLLIEDDEGEAYLTRRAFDASVVKVQLLVLHDSTTVLSFLRNNITTLSFSRPDLILLDLCLPKKNGISLLREIKRDRTLSDIPVVIVTNSMRTEDMMTCYQEHASGYISKSFDFDEFTHKLDALARYWLETVVLPSKQQEGEEDSCPVGEETDRSMNTKQVSSRKGVIAINT